MKFGSQESFDGKTESRFWMKVSVLGSNDCWEWLGSKAVNGYGKMRICKRVKSAHRVSYAIKHGSVPLDLFVCHSCDNKLCVNPNHLWLGTIQDNHKDMCLKGRIARGINHGSVTHPEKLPRGANNKQSKLTEDDVRKIRESYVWRTSGCYLLAKRFKVTPKTIHKIVTRETWDHIA